VGTKEKEGGTKERRGQESERKKIDAILERGREQETMRI
jgi:hypothetical protein